MAELLLDILEQLLPRSFLLPSLMRGWLFTSIIPVKHSFVVTVSGGYVGIMPPGPAIFSSSVSVSGGDEVLLLLLWYGIAAFMGLLFILWSLHLFDEFRQFPQQTLIGETEGLHFIASSVKSSENVSWLPAVNVVLLVLCPRGVGVTPAHVSSQHHQSLRNQFICKGRVVPTDGAKLMVLFLSIRGRSVLGSLGQSVGSDHRTTCKLH